MDSPPALCSGTSIPIIARMKKGESSTLEEYT
jgi:hypothetical protein